MESPANQHCSLQSNSLLETSTAIFLFPGDAPVVTTSSAESLGLAEATANRKHAGFLPVGSRVRRQLEDKFGVPSETRSRHLWRARPHHHVIPAFSSPAGA